MGNNASKEKGAGNMQLVLANNDLDAQRRARLLFNEEVAVRNTEISKALAAEARLIHGSSVGKTGPYLPGPHERALERKFAESNEDNHKFYYSIKEAILAAVLEANFKDGVFRELIDENSTLRHDFNTMAFADNISASEKKVIEDACRVYCKSLGDWRTKEQTLHVPDEDDEEWKTAKGFNAIDELKLMFDAYRRKEHYYYDDTDDDSEYGNQTLEPRVYSKAIEAGYISDPDELSLEVASINGEKKLQKKLTFPDGGSKVADQKNDQSLPEQKTLALQFNHEDENHEDEAHFDNSITGLESLSEITTSTP